LARRFRRSHRQQKKVIIIAIHLWERKRVGGPNRLLSLSLVDVQAGLLNLRHALPVSEQRVKRKE
jgi:hypothetical protein